MLSRTVIFSAFVFLLLSCGKNDGIRTAGGPYYPAGPSQPVLPPLSPTSPYPSYPGGYGPGGGGGYGGGFFQPSFSQPYGPQFYPWMPIYVYYQQVV
ncbi:hypothetical protein EBT16_07170 [bacterium]|nr:hypothetical protein [bacterium]